MSNTFFLSSLFYAVAILGGLTLLLTTLLVFANKRLRVDEDPRIDAVDQMLPQNNCGACGFPGCRAFAEALVQNTVSPSQCTVSTGDNHKHIAAFLGVDVGSQEKRVARLACAGGSNVARQQANYTGISSCRAAAIVTGGGKRCSWGCLGLGDCAVVCQFDAIKMNSHSLPEVDEDRCTACGDCVSTCPKDLFSLHPVSHLLWVACSSLGMGDSLLDDCHVACTACGRCAMDAPGHVISMVNNLPVVDYDESPQTQTPIERCPTGAIIWFNADGTSVKGEESRHVIRDAALPATPS
ncbi:RnfABCDGE type electron transport complex subunit B [Pseudomonadota bacterium]